MSTGGPDGSFSPADVQKIAVFQKVVLFCILGYLIALLTQCLIPAEIRLPVYIAAVVLNLTASLFILLLLLKIHGVAMAVILSLLSLIPVVNLAIVLMINGQATDILKRHGVKVGFFGATK